MPRACKLGLEGIVFKRLGRPIAPPGRGTGLRARIRRHQRSSVRPKKIGAKRNGDDRSRPGRVLILKRAGAGNEAVASFTEIFAAIGAFILGSGAISAIAFGLFKVLGEKWLNAKFEERLAEYKHAQQKEIEQLRFRINALMDRTTKLHQHEFDVLPEAWSRLNDAFAQTSVLVSPIQSYPDLNRMTEEHINEYLKNTPLQEWEKAELMAQTDKTKFFMKRIFWYRLSDAKAACREHHTYLKKSGIFIPTDVKEKFYELDTLMWDALGEHQANEEIGQLPRMREKIDAFRKKGPELLTALEQQVQTRLWNAQSD